MLNAKQAKTITSDSIKTFLIGINEIIVQSAKRGAVKCDWDVIKSISDDVVAGVVLQLHNNGYIVKDTTPPRPSSKDIHSYDYYSFYDFIHTYRNRYTISWG